MHRQFYTHTLCELVLKTTWLQRPLLLAPWGGRLNQFLLHVKVESSILTGLLSTVVPLGATVRRYYYYAQRRFSHVYFLEYTHAFYRQSCIIHCKCLLHEVGGILTASQVGERGTGTLDANAAEPGTRCRAATRSKFSCRDWLTPLFFISTCGATVTFRRL